MKNNGGLYNRLSLVAVGAFLEVNSINHDFFHMNKDSLPELPDSILTAVVKNALDENDIHGKIAYGIYDDSLYQIIKTNVPEAEQQLTSTSAKACLSCIVSFSTINKNQIGKVDRNIPDSGDILKRSTFQYYRPIIGGINSKKQLWFSLHQTDILRATLGKMIGLFIGNVLLLLVLLILFYFLLRALTRYKNITQVKEDFFNNMTHEFKTPLSSIRLASRVLMKGTDSNQRQEYLKLIDKESLALEYHIDKILELSLINDDKLELNKSNIDLLEILKNIPHRIRPLVDRSNAKINIHSSLESFSFWGDAFHIKNAFSNLVENSLKYGPDGVVVDIEISIDNKRAPIYSIDSIGDKKIINIKQQVSE